MEKHVRSDAVLISRAALYRQVWTTPLTQLAARYKTTTTELAAICSRLNVPRPPSGHWMKKSNGKPVMQLELPAPAPDTPLEAIIGPPQNLRETRTQIELAQARKKYAGLSVSENIGRPHPVVEHWLVEQDRRKREAARISDPSHRALVQPKEFSALDHRRFRFLDAFFKAVEEIGFEAKVDQYHKAYLIFDGERVDFTLRERQKLVRRPLDDDRYKGWDKKLEPTGDLIFKITTWLPQELLTAWRDNSDKPLEWQLDDIVAVLSLTGPHLVRKRNEQAEVQKRRWQEEHQQLLSRQRREQDMKRWALMLEFARKRDLAESVRRLIAEVELLRQPEGRFDGRTSAEWLAWARDWLERFDPLMREPQELYAELGAIRA